MSSQYFVISSHQIIRFSSEPSETPEIEPISPGSDLTVSLTRMLDKHQYPANTSVGLILDNEFSPYQHVTLPFLKTRKLSKIIEFEIEDTRLNTDWTFINSIRSTSNKEKSLTDVGVYSIPREWVSQLIQACKERHLDLKWITPLYNLLDIQVHTRHQPGNAITVFIDDHLKTAWFAVYSRNFLIAVSRLTAKDLESKEFINRVNQKINAISISDPTPFQIYLDQDSEKRYVVDEQTQVVSRETNSTDTAESIPGFIKRCLDPDNLKHPQKINLLRSNHLIIQEIKKNSSWCVAASVLLGFSILIYLTSIGYSSIQDNQRKAELTQVLNSVTEKYLPRGASKANAERILEENLNRIRQELNENKRFENRTYPVSTTLAELSAIKAEIPSLKLIRFTMNDQAVRFQGTVDSISEFEGLRDALPELYPTDEYSITFNQKNRGADIVEFSISIQTIR